MKVAVSEEANRRMPEAMLCKLTLVMKSGATYTAVVEYHKGHYRNPMSESEVEAKFRKLAADVITLAQSDRLLERLWKLEDVADAGEVVRLTVVG